MPRGIPSSFIYGSRCAKAFERAYRLKKEYFGSSHAQALTRVLTYTELPMIVEEVINNCIVREIDGGLLSQYVSVLKEGLVSIKLPQFSYKLGGCYAFFEAKLQELVKYNDLKTGVFHLFRVMGNSLALLHLLEGEADMDDIIGFQHSAGFLGHSIKPSPESGPFVDLMAKFSAVPLAPSAARVGAECAFAAKRAHAMHYPSSTSLLLVRPALRKIAEALKKQKEIFSPLPKNGFLEVEACDSFHRLWSSLQFLFEKPLTRAEQSQGNRPDEYIFGDGFAWGGIALVYLCGQMPTFELCDFSYHLLKVAEWEQDIDVAKTQHKKMTAKKDSVSDELGNEFTANALAFAKVALRQKFLNDVLFSVFENALPDPLGTVGQVMIVHPPEDDTSLSEQSKLKIVKTDGPGPALAPASAPAASSGWFGGGSTPAPAAPAPAASKLDKSAPKFDTRNPLDAVGPPAPPPAPHHEEEEEEEEGPPPPAEEEEEEEAEEEQEELTPPDHPLPPGAIWAVALWDYDKVEDGELTFKENDFVVVTNTPDGGWWEGYIPAEGEVGMFPSNYVEPRE